MRLKILKCDGLTHPLTEGQTALKSTVLQIQVYPKKNAPRVSKPLRVAKSDFLLILKIFLNLDDIQTSN